MADPLGEVFGGKEGSGLAQIIKTKGIAPSDALQRAVADEKKKQADTDKKRMAGIGMAMKLLDDSKINGWFQDTSALQGGHAAIRKDITETMARDGEAAYDVTTEKGWNNMLRLRGATAEFAAINKYSQQQQELYDTNLEKYIANPDKYNESSLKKMEDWKKTPLSQRIDAEVPVLEAAARDWRKNAGSDKVIDNYLNKYAVSETVEGGAIETISGTNVDKGRIYKSAQNGIEGYLFDPDMEAVFDEEKTMILGNEIYSRIWNDEAAIEALIVTPYEDLPENLKEFGTGINGLSLGAKRITDYQIPRLAKSYKKTLTKAMAGRGSTNEQVFARIDLIDGIQKGDPESLSSLKGKFRDGRIVDVTYDADRGQVTYTWEDKDRIRETRSIDVTEEAGGGIGEVNNLLNEIQGTKINEEDFARREEAEGAFVSRREVPEKAIDLNRVREDVDAIINVFDPKRPIPFFQRTLTKPTRVLSSIPGVKDVKFTENPNTLTFLAGDNTVEIDLEDIETNPAKRESSYRKLQDILIDQNREKYLKTAGEKGVGWQKVTQEGNEYWYNANTGEAELIGPAQ